MMDVRLFGTGYRPDPIDARDYLIKASVPVIPATVMYDPFMLPVRNQGREGTCVSFAGAALKEYYDNRQRSSTDYFAPRYLYAMCKTLDGAPNEEGTYPRTAMQVFQDFGIAYESDWPYQEYQGNNPGDWMPLHQKAMTQRIRTYARLYSTRDMITNLILNGPFIVGLYVTDGFYTDEAIRTGYVDPTIQRDREAFGHAMCVTGWDNERSMFKVRNSWGTEYGDDGYNWMTRSWMAEHAVDAWSIVDDTAIDQGLIVAKPIGV